ncbi:hypothetical protein OIE13_34625 [Streptosporangium sp. NBC_01810]|uniref:hypothetical protein n=1 Tax=Streptosporangium sp. NBC_01810 TaxID=2975951 RepID=UPI002DDA6217|nr:hypothetical protein [Streptosporangium sp. NBC_01810]WSA25977.1 hypothetical protein OIE13_34625 [Streptosporangium sp. NBC_01810]
MGIVQFSRHEWTPSPLGHDQIIRRDRLNLAISLARVVLVNGLASIAGSRHGSFDSLRLEAQLLATALANTRMKGSYALHRTRSFDCSSLHIKSFVITGAGLGLLTASIESLMIQGKLKSFQIRQFDLMPALTPRGPRGGNSRPDLLINLPDGRQMVGEAKGRRKGSSHTTKEKRKFLSKLHEWASNNKYEGFPLALSWASILEDKTIVDLYHTDPTKEVEPLSQHLDQDIQSSPDLREEFLNQALPSTGVEDLQREWTRIVRNLTEPTPIQFYEDPLFWSAPNPPRESQLLAGLPIRGSWSPIGADGRSLFVGIFKEEPEGDSLTKIRRTYFASLEGNTVAPLDIAAEGRLIFAIAQNGELATWRALQRIIN